MEKYFVLMRLTDKGADKLDAVPNLLEGVREKAVQDEFIGADTAIYAVFGGLFDFIADCDANNFDDAAYFAIELAKTGYVQTSTQKGYSVSEFRSILMHKMAP